MTVDDRRRGGTVLWWAAVVASVAIAACGVAALAAGADNPNPYSWPQFSIGVSAVAVGAFVARRRPSHPLGWLLLLAGASAWASFAGVPVLSWMMVHTPTQQGAFRWILHVAVSGWILSEGLLIGQVPLSFPDGFGRTWWRRLLLAGASLTLAAWALAHSLVWTPEYFQGQPATGYRAWLEDLEPTTSKANLLIAVLCMATMLVATLRATEPERRRQRGFAIAITALLAPTLVDLFHTLVHQLPNGLVDTNSTIQVWALAAAPVVLGVGVVRHQLLDIQVIVRRATVYATVVAAGAALYLATVWVVATVRPGSDAVPAVVGAAAVAISLGLVRDRVNRWASRRLFGSRDDPYEVLRTLGASLEAAPIGEQALQTVTDTVCRELRLPFAAATLVLEEDGEQGVRVTVGQTGELVEGGSESFPLAHQGVMLGQLVVGRRSPDEPLTAGERDLVATLARQAGVLAHNLTLVEALRRSRVVLLNAREEERRRIRADLHDGLGPTLATVALGIEAGANRLGDEPELAALLHDLEQELHTAIADVRALVHNLRPAALDDLGLVSAVREYATSMAVRSAGTDAPLEVVVDAPPELGPLPAAVEVAAYRVALEALANVARHARASSCSVRVRATDGLALEVEDDGIGIGEAAGAGIGLRSMRERVTELGGRFSISGGPGRGTRIVAWFPTAELSAG
ncbi:MAG: GAF domain-containing sensor histidine kinase [Acidimicrobiales bacterium]